MKKVISIILICSIFLVGCKDNRKYEESINAGKESIENSKYETALEHFKNALEEKENNEEAIYLYEQTNNYIKALKYYNNRQFEDSIKILEGLINKDDGSEVLINHARTLKENIESEKKLDDSIEQLNISAQNYFKSGNYEKAIEEINSGLELINNNPHYETQKDSLNNLKSSCNTAINQINKAKEEEKARLEATRKEEAAKNQAVSEDQAIKIVENYIKNNVGYVPNSVEVFETIDGKYHILADHYDEDTGTRGTFGWYFVEISTGKIVK